HAYRAQALRLGFGRWGATRRQRDTDRRGSRTTWHSSNHRHRLRVPLPQAGPCPLRAVVEARATGRAIAGGEAGTSRLAPGRRAEAVRGAVQLKVSRSPPISTRL